MKWLLALLLAQSFPTHHYQVTDITAQPPIVVEQYDSGPCLAADVWTGSFVFCATPTPTPSPTPAPTPPAGSTIVTFEAPSPCPKLGIYAGIDFGVGQWTCSVVGWFGLKPNNISFSQSVTSRSFTFMVPSTLLALDASTATAGHLRLSSDSGEALEADLAKGVPVTLQTNWAKPANVVKVEFSGGWLISFGKLVYK